MERHYVFHVRRSPGSSTGGIVRGWAVSVALHSLLVGTALVVAADWNPLPRRTVFQWDVSLVLSPPPKPIEADVPSLFDLAPESPPVASEIEPPPPDAPLLETPPIADNTTTAPAKVSEVSHPDVPLERDSTEAVIARTQQTVSDAAPKPVAPSPTISQSTPAPREAPNVQPRASIDDPVPFSAAGQADLPPPDVDRRQDSPMAQEPAIREVAALMTRPAAQQRPQPVSRPVRADYGWLAEALRAKVEQLKRYPYLAKINRWQGNVVLEAVIQADGSIEEITVVQSSGYAMLDQDAAALLRGASPLALAHPLGESHVVIHIPIGYRLE